MIAMIVATHSTLCLGLKESGEFVSGSHENAYFIQLDGNGVDTFRSNLARMIEDVHQKYDTVLFLTDLKNATPYNEITRHLISGKYPGDRLVSGVNLAMYIECALGSEGADDVDELADMALFAGRASIAKLDAAAFAEGPEEDDEDL